METGEDRDDKIRSRVCSQAMRRSGLTLRVVFPESGECGVGLGSTAMMGWSGDPRSDCPSTCWCPCAHRASRPLTVCSRAPAEPVRESAVDVPQHVMGAVRSGTVARCWHGLSQRAVAHPVANNSARRNVGESADRDSEQGELRAGPVLQHDEPWKGKSHGSYERSWKLQRTCDRDDPELPDLRSGGQQPSEHHIHEAG
eukprot:1380287-Rhodomonas_salina.1